MVKELNAENRNGKKNMEGYMDLTAYEGNKAADATARPWDPTPREEIERFGVYVIRNRNGETNLGVVVSTSEVHIEHNNVLVVFTSKKPWVQSEDNVLLESMNERYACCNAIATVCCTSVGRKICNLSEADEKAVCGKVKKCMGLADEDYSDAVERAETAEKAFARVRLDSDDATVRSLEDTVVRLTGNLMLLQNLYDSLVRQIMEK